MFDPFSLGESIGVFVTRHILFYSVNDSFGIGENITIELKRNVIRMSSEQVGIGESIQATVVRAPHTVDVFGIALIVVAIALAAFVVFKVYKQWKTRPKDRW